MEISSQVVTVVMGLLALGIVLAVIMFVSYQGGAAKIMELILGFFRGV